MSELSSLAPGLLYLGFAFPPGVAALHPGLNPAGHGLETQLVSHLRRHFAVRSVGVLPIATPDLPDADPASGVDHDLRLLEKAPELLYRLRSLRRLKEQYCLWRALGWEPEAVLVYNLTPIYNQFILWLHRQPRRPKLVLLLSDSPNLGQRQPWLKQMRRRCKPFYVSDAEMLPRFDACVGLSPEVERHFRPRGTPFLWLPGGCDPGRAPDSTAASRKGPLRFGYFGALGAHAGVTALAEVFGATDLPATLEVWGYGKQNGLFAELARTDPRIVFRGLRSPGECLQLEQSCDVLANPRPLSHGNENNFPSKLFEYVLSGRAILTTRLSGADRVLGPEAFYIEPEDFSGSLRRGLHLAAGCSRAELDRRGKAIQERVLRQYCWEKQTQRLAGFLNQVCGEAETAVETPAALAA